MRKSLIVAAALLVIPAVSHAKTLDELLVEKGVITKGEASGATSSSASKTYWNDGSRFEFPDNGFTAGFATMLQERYTFTDNDEATGLKNTSSFDVQRARVILSGTALHNEFSYKLENDFASNANGAVIETGLLDAYVDWHACDWATIRMGQFKTLNGRQWNTLDWKTQFPDNSRAGEYFSLGRQQGVSGETMWADGKVVLSAGIFNGISDGEGINSTGVDTNNTGVVSARFNIMGEMDSYSESDVEYTEDMAVSAGAAYAYSDANSAAFGDTTLDDITVDANLKYRGLSLNGEFFYRNIETDAFQDDTQPIGFYAQAGYFLNPKKLEIAARYGYLDCDANVTQGTTAGGICAGYDKVNEIAAAINYYWWKHHLKASFAYFFLNQDAIGDNQDLDVNTNKWMFQLSSYF